LGFFDRKKVLALLVLFFLLYTVLNKKPMIETREDKREIRLAKFFMDYYHKIFRFQRAIYEPWDMEVKIFRKSTVYTDYYVIIFPDDTINYVHQNYLEIINP
jgi:hypothetical protein